MRKIKCRIVHDKDRIGPEDLSRAVNKLDLLYQKLLAKDIPMPLATHFKLSFPEKEV